MPRTKSPFKFRCRSLIWAGLWLILTVAQAAAAPPPLRGDSAGTVALDAGHGGKDLGARGPDGVLEKDVCLNLARQLTTLLEPSYQVVLTRSDDYAVELTKRTALANHNRADMLISLHTAAGYQHATTGMAVYYYRPAAAQPTDAPQSPSKAKGTPLLWDDVQLRHASASQTLAADLQQALQRLPGLPHVDLRQGPLAVLAGADMPAVLIEIGYLTNPATEKELSSEDTLAAYARALAQGIDDYMAAARKLGEIRDPYAGGRRN